MSQAPPKRRRLRGACDICRKKKIRCNSSEMPGNKCSNCIFFKTQCTHLYISKENTSSSLNYKNSREHVAAILSTKTAYVPSNDPAVLYQNLVDIAKYARNLEEMLAVSSSTSLDLLSSPFADAEHIKSTDTREADDGVFVEDIIEPLTRLALGASTSGVQEKFLFFGKSSSVNFIKVAMEDVHKEGEAFDAQRLEFWNVQNWHPAPPEPRQTFPDDDLLQSLIDIYFRKLNPMIFLLHSTTFRASVADGEHLRDPHFGAVVLAVCALASRLSDNPAVLMAPDAPLHSAGWKWFSQTRPLQLVSLPPASGSQFRTIHNLQLICLAVLFVSTSSVRASWILSGLGIRIAQEIGAHRRSRYAMGSTAEGELLKRAWWILISTDTILNSMFGRPTVTTSEDYDVDLPTECDDEYWNELHSFQQPAEKPALTAFMTSYLKLMIIFSRAQRTIYPVKKQKENESGIVAELDSALNEWVDSIPNHLRWDPNRDGIFLDQSASLYITYYYGFPIAQPLLSRLILSLVQMLIHRPFISAPGEIPATDSAFPSLAICANSARSCGHVMEVQSRRNGSILHYPYAIPVLFDSAVILLLNVWGGRRATSPSDITRAVVDIKKCVDVLHLYEKQYPVAGRQCDMITEMLNRASGNTPHSSWDPTSLKRTISEDRENEDVHVFIKPLSPATAVQQLEELELSIQQTKHLFSLPLHTEELGLLPIYESFDFQFNFDPHMRSPGSMFESPAPDGAYLNTPEQPQNTATGDEFIVPENAYSW